MPEFRFQEMFELSSDDTAYRRIGDAGLVSVEKLGGREILRVEPEALRQLAAAAIRDVSHLFRPGHLAQLRAILDDPEASANDRFVALEMLKNANVSAGMILPSCQDTGTAIVIGKKGENVFTGARRRGGALARRLRHLHEHQPALLADGAALDVRGEEHRHATCPRRSSSTPRPATSTTFLFVTKGGGSANKSFLYQETRAILEPESLLRFLDAKIRTLGTAACPPYHLAIVIGGTSAEFTLKTVKLASTRYLDTLPDHGQRGGPRLPRPRARGAGAEAHRRRRASAPSSAASTSATTCA